MNNKRRFHQTSNDVVKQRVATTSQNNGEQQKKGAKENVRIFVKNFQIPEKFGIEHIASFRQHMEDRLIRPVTVTITDRRDLPIDLARHVALLRLDFRDKRNDVVNECLDLARLFFDSSYSDIEFLQAAEKRGIANPKKLSPEGYLLMGSIYRDTSPSIPAHV